VLANLEVRAWTFVPSSWVFNIRIK